MDKKIEDRVQIFQHIVWEGPYGITSFIFYLKNSFKRKIGISNVDVLAIAIRRLNVTQMHKHIWRLIHI